jgi:NAD(P)-dependent dehydrogenase (short-subunit alcohol dehydrogenase family)
MKDFSGKRVVITGGSEGLGLAMARAKAMIGRGAQAGLMGIQAALKTPMKAGTWH